MVLLGNSLRDLRKLSCGIWWVSGFALTICEGETRWDAFHQPHRANPVGFPCMWLKRKQNTVMLSGWRKPPARGGGTGDICSYLSGWCMYLCCNRGTLLDPQLLLEAQTAAVAKCFSPHLHLERRLHPCQLHMPLSPPDQIVQLCSVWCYS